MFNYAIDPAALAPLVPRGTVLDLWNGQALVSLVAFMFVRTRVLRLAIPWHCNFEELNLRFYVRHESKCGESRRGVVFIKEIVPRWAIATVARVLYGENYVSMPMRHNLELAGSTLRLGGAAEYGWRLNGRWNTLRAVTDGVAAPAIIGSEEEFITEHYWGYARQRDGGCCQYAVEHPRWNVWRVREPFLDCDAAALYGPAFGEALARPPRSAFVADGSDIAVRFGVRL